MPRVSPGPPVSSGPLTHPFTLSGCRGPRGGTELWTDRPPALSSRPAVSAFRSARTPWLWSHVHTLGARSTCKGEVGSGSFVHLVTSGSAVSLLSAVLGHLALTLEPSVGCPSGSPGSVPPGSGSRGPACGLAFPSPGLSAGRGSRSDPLESAVTSRPSRCCVHGVGLTVSKPGATGGVASVTGAVESHCSVLRRGLTRSDVNIQNPSERSEWQMEDRAC